MPNRSDLARLLATPENGAALVAIQDLLAGLSIPGEACGPIPLFLCGPSGSGKTHLMQALAAELTRLGVDVAVHSAHDFAEPPDPADLVRATLLVLEDLQHLPARGAEILISLIDERLCRGMPLVFTALHGPSALRLRGKPMPHRLTNRLAGGLVVELRPMQAPSRRRLLEIFAYDAKLNLAPETLQWLAENSIGGGRQLEGAIKQLTTLQKLQRQPLQPSDIQAHFRPQIAANTPTPRRIAEHVSGHYGVKPKLVLSARRSHDVLLPRQISMYLARQLTNLSLQKIGMVFGGRDHKTVRHACIKVELAMEANMTLAGTVRQLRAQLA